MKTVLISVLAATAALGIHCPAAAQLEPEAPLGTRIPKSLEDFPVDKTSELVRDFAECAVKKRYPLARELLLSVTEYYLPDKYSKIADPHCLGQRLVGSPYGAAQLRMSTGILRFAIADALVARDLKAYDPGGIASAAPLPPLVFNPEDLTGISRRSKKEREETAFKAKAEIELIKYGECVVRANPQGARQLLATAVNSHEEAAALGSMMPAFRGCLNIGQQFKASRTLLRGTVALNYFRLAYAPKLPTPAARTAGRPQ